MTDYTQTTFGFNPPAGSVGEIYDYQSASFGEDDGLTAGETIAFGRLVFTAAATPNVAEIPTTSGEVARARGIAVKTQAKPSGQGYLTGEQVRILKRGRVRVYFEGAIADGAQVYVRITESSSGAGDVGQFRADADTDKAVAVPGCRARAVNGVISAAGIGVIEFDFGPDAG